MTLHPVVEHSINLLQTYQWGSLWKGVRAIHPHTPESEQLPPLVKQQLLALKALLLAGWWESPQLTDELLPLLERSQDPLVHFGCRYALMARGDLKGLKALQARQPAAMPRWMQDWLEVEYLGRSLQDKAQMQRVRRILKQHQGELPDWVKVAILQSLSHNQANLRFLQQLIQQQHWHQSRDPLILSLCLRAQTLTLAQVEDSLSNHKPNTQAEPLPPYLQWRQANRHWADVRLPEALKAYDQLMPSYFADVTTLQRWLLLSVSLPEGRASLIKRVSAAQAIAPDDPMTQGILASYGLIGHWLNGDMQAAYELVEKHHQVQHLPVNDLTKNAQIFFRYVLSLCIAWQHNPSLYQNNPSLPALHILGESHSLSPTNVGITLGDTHYLGQTHFLMGIKMYHLARPNASYHARLLEARLATLHLETLKAKPVHLLLTIGEIDCRPDEGFWPAHRKTGQPLDALIERTVTGYIDFLQRTLVDHQLLSITVQGIPAPGYALEDDKDPGDIPGFVAMIRAVNDCLRAKTLAAGFNFLDVHAATVGEDGRGNGRWHLDGYHLSPAFYRQAQDWLRLPNLTKDSHGPMASC